MEKLPILAETDGIQVVQGEDESVHIFAFFPRHSELIATMSYEAWVGLIEDAIKRRML